MSANGRVASSRNRAGRSLAIFAPASLMSRASLRRKARSPNVMPGGGGLIIPVAMPLFSISSRDACTDHLTGRILCSFIAATYASGT
jgi:hypothetical protein